MTPRPSAIAYGHGSPRSAPAGSSPRPASTAGGATSCPSATRGRRSWAGPGRETGLARQPLHLLLEAPVLGRGIEPAHHGPRDEPHRQPELRSPREERGPEPFEVTRLEDDGPGGAGMAERWVVDRDRRGSEDPVETGNRGGGAPRARGRPTRPANVPCVEARTRCARGASPRHRARPPPCAGTPSA